MFTAITSTQWQSRTTVAPNHVDSEPLAHCRDNGSARALSSVVSTTIGFTTWTVKCHVIHVIYNRPCSNEFQEGKLCPAQLFPCVGWENDSYLFWPTFCASQWGLKRSLLKLLVSYWWLKSHVSFFMSHHTTINWD